MPVGLDVGTIAMGFVVSVEDEDVVNSYHMGK